MQVNVAGLRRNIKNLAHNYSDAQVKVREATSNDPWGPSATIMAEIADLTYNVVAFSEIMQMIWKRLNDHGKNWRHVYKALILLEYLIKTGTEKVAQQCKENCFAIQTLRDFVYFEEGKDQGTHVREKAKQLVNLLKDDERLKNERVKALKAKERFAQHASGFGSDGYIEGPTHRDAPPGWQEEPKPVSELEMVRPQTAGEEELQLQLAMAMSREEAEQEEAKRRSDDVRLQLALSQSEQDFKVKPAKEEPQSHLLDLLDISLSTSNITSPPLGAAGGSSDPWGTLARPESQLSDPWSGTSSPPIDPWQPSAMKSAAVPLGAVSGTDAWMSQRTQSPSVASGSSNEGWLQSNHLLLNGATNGNSAVVDPWIAKHGAAAVPASAQPHLPNNITTSDPWLAESRAKGPKSAADVADPWAPKGADTSNPDSWRSITQKTSPDMDEFDIITNRTQSSADLLSNNITIGSNNNNTSLLDELDPLSSSMSSSTGTTKKPLKTPQAFLGENSSLVNLDNLIKPVVPQTSAGNAAYNPFSDNVIPPKTNLFQQQQPTVPSINQLKQQQPFTMNINQDPWAPHSNSAASSQLKEDDFLIDYDSDQITIQFTTTATIEPYHNPSNSINGSNNLHDNNNYSYNQKAKYDVFDTNYCNNSIGILKRSISANNDSYNSYSNSFLMQQNYNNNSHENNSYASMNSNRMHSEYSINPRNSLNIDYMPSNNNNNNSNINNINNNNINNNNINNNQQNPLKSSANGYSNALSASLAGTPRLIISSLSAGAGGVGSLFSYGFYDSKSAGGAATAVNSCHMESNNNSSSNHKNNNSNSVNNNSSSSNNISSSNMPWVKPEAVASNPFLS